MILMLTTSYCWTANVLVDILVERSIPIFRFNSDRYWEYKFVFSDNEFEIVNGNDERLQSKDVKYVVSYKSHLNLEENFQTNLQIKEEKWVRSSLNYVVQCIMRWAIQHSCLKLWTPYEMLYPKTLQMHVAQKYFSVPDYNIHWGFAMERRDVIVKSMIARPFEDKSFLFAKLVDVNSLSPLYPWFTQDPAAGSRDATVLYINGKVHCYQFATERNELTDWRVTQGTEVNRWEQWDAGDEFENKVRAFMQEMGLKFGRLDFIIGGKEPQFLEVNPCGQFGWLDDEERELHREVVEAILEPSSVITL